MTPIFKAEINGRCPVKKNKMKVVRRHGNTIVIYSPEFREWERIALLALKQANQGQTIDEPLEARFKFYFKNRSGEADLSNLIDSPQDALTKAGVIIDDRIIQLLQAEKVFGHEPKVEIELYRLEGA